MDSAWDDLIQTIALLRKKQKLIMKKVVKVSVGNLASTIDEDGYELLKSYLGELKAHYKSKQNGNEIIEGIEERIAELLLRNRNDSVVSIEVVKDVVNILGRPR